MNPGCRANGIYVYCITEGDPFTPEEGLHPLRPVYCLTYEDLAAVVSQVSLDEFGEDALHSHLEDPCWLDREVRAHERVIQEMMQSRTVLPMKFCTIFLTEGRVCGLLVSHQQEFRRALARLREKEEWQVKMYFEPASPARPETAKGDAGPSGTEYLLKTKAQDLAASQMMTEASHQAQRSYEKLLGCAEEVQLKPVPAPNSSGGPTLILDAVSLLPRPRFDAFRQELNELGNELAAKGFHFQLSGPWPPYHFTHLAQENVGSS